jgi:hypothetical protein
LAAQQRRSADEALPLAAQVTQRRGAVLTPKAATIQRQEAPGAEPTPQVIVEPCDVLTWQDNRNLLKVRIPGVIPKKDGQAPSKAQRGTHPHGGEGVVCLTTDRLSLKRAQEYLKPWPSFVAPRPKRRRVQDEGPDEAESQEGGSLMQAWPYQPSDMLTQEEWDSQEPVADECQEGGEVCMAPTQADRREQTVVRGKRAGRKRAQKSFF